MTDREELSVGEQAARERLSARATQTIDPIVVGILKRALEVARRNDLPTVGLKEVLESFLHATITPALIHHLQAARSIAEEEQRGEYVYVGDVSVFAAALAEPTSLVYQILEHHVDDMDALVSRVWARVRDTDAATDS